MLTSATILCLQNKNISDCGLWISDLLYRFALSFFIKSIEFLKSAICNPQSAILTVMGIVRKQHVQLSIGRSQNQAQL